MKTSTYNAQSLTLPVCEAEDLRPRPVISFIERLGQSKTRVKIIKELDRCPHLTSGELSDRLKIDEAVIRMELIVLVRMGAVDHYCRKRKQYFLTNDTAHALIVL